MIIMQNLQNSKYIIGYDLYKLSLIALGFEIIINVKPERFFYAIIHLEEKIVPGREERVLWIKANWLLRLNVSTEAEDV